MMNIIFDRFIQAFSVEFIFTVIFATYFAIKLFETAMKGIPVPSWVKKLVTVVVGTILFFVFVWITDTPKETLLSSYFAALFLYDYAIKWLLRKFNVNYKK
jgi:hypothetical protein